jgi:hypothetical protein
MSGAPGGVRGQRELFDRRAGRMLGDGINLVLEDEMWLPTDGDDETPQGIPVILDSTRLFAVGGAV